MVACVREEGVGRDQVVASYLRTHSAMATARETGRGLVVTTLSEYAAVTRASTVRAVRSCVLVFG